MPAKVADGGEEGKRVWAGKLPAAAAAAEGLGKCAAPGVPVERPATAARVAGERPSSRGGSGAVNLSGTCRLSGLSAPVMVRSRASSAAARTCANRIRMVVVDTCRHVVSKDYIGEDLYCVLLPVNVHHGE